MALLQSSTAPPRVSDAAPGALPSPGARVQLLLFRWLGISLALFSLYVVAELTYLGELAARLRLPWMIAAPLLGAAAAVSWSAREPRIDSLKVQYAVELLIRFALAYVFISYGLAKLYHAQFKPPSMYQLHQPVGSLPGIQVAWLFFGYSHAYASFIALSQIACSILLFFRRTQLLGACLLLTIVGNIVFVNFTHHIPVRFNSSVYLVLAAYLVLADFGRLKALFWDNAPVPPRPVPALDPRWRWARRLAAAAFAVASFAYSAWIFEQMMAPVRPAPTPLYGGWRVESIEPPGALAVTGGEHAGASWTRVFFEKQWQGKQGVAELGEARTGFSYEVDAARRTVAIRSQPGRPPFPPFRATYELSDDRLLLRGKAGGTPVEVTLTKLPLDRHWSS